MQKPFRSGQQGVVYQAPRSIDWKYGLRLSGKIIGAIVMVGLFGPLIVMLLMIVLSLFSYLVLFVLSIYVSAFREISNVAYELFSHLIETRF